MTTPFASGFNDTLPVSDTAGQFNLATDTEQTYTVPGANSKIYRATFSGNLSSNVLIGINVSPTAPLAGTSSSDGNVLINPFWQAYYVKGGDEINMTTPDTAGAYVGISLLLIPS